ncbi:E1 C-terminal related 1 [Actinidia rufa]|uniref:NEDD8-activating enzyme E1 catalytic subunit n=1 Tax=Actinidia rufa TaxID=165716 RepID=A0A7J0EF34_9ERIC|nr:E1 C-terminal related 1 [Actinidia rufa]
MAQSRSRDLDKLLLRHGHLVGPNFEPGPDTTFENMRECWWWERVVWAANFSRTWLSRVFETWEVIDMDRIEVSNLNRQFLFRLGDVGKPKAEVAAKRVMERVAGVNIVPHFCRIEDKELDFYNDFSIIVLGLDSIEARSYINSVACGFLVIDSEDLPRATLRAERPPLKVLQSPKWASMVGRLGKVLVTRPSLPALDIITATIQPALLKPLGPPILHRVRLKEEPKGKPTHSLVINMASKIFLPFTKHMTTWQALRPKYDSDDNPREETIKPMVDGGTEGFKGHARVIVPGVTPCFECTIWLFPPQVKFPLCTLAETPRTAAHCIEYAHLIKWDEVHSGKTFDPDNPEHMQWVYSEAVKRAELFGIPGVTYSLTQGVVKNIIPAIASTNAIISAACALETLKIASACSKTLSNYLTYNGVEGLHTKVTEFVKDKDCLVCGPGVLMEVAASVTLGEFITLLEDHPKLLLSRASVTHRGKNLYMQAPPVLEEMTRSNLDLPLFDLMDKVPKDVVHVTGTTSKSDKKTSSLRKLRVVFKGVDGVSDMDTAGGA